MTDVLGLNAEIAARLLEAEGYTVRCVPLSSRKGVEGDDTRVIRQRILASAVVPNTVELICTAVKTECSEI